MEHQIVLKPEVIAYFRSFPITNTMFVSWIVTAILSALGFWVGRNPKPIPSGIQNSFEAIIEFGYNTVEELAHSKAQVFFPLVMTFFLFIVTANWLGLLPGFATVGFFVSEHGKQAFVPLLRSPNSDLNATLALALLSAVATHLFAIRYLGIKSYLLRWISLNPIFLFVGILEIVSEFTKVVSLSFRLFGNIFAGEVVLATVTGIFAFLVPLPFYLLEIIVGFVQAAVFMMLTLVFMVLLSDRQTSH